MNKEIQDLKFWALSAEEVSARLNTDLKTGLTEQEARARVSIFGRNTIKSNKRASSLLIILNQLKSPLILVLILAGIITLGIGHFKDSIFIFIAVVVNTLLGYYQENKAEKALANLKTYLRQRARVIRDNIEKEIDAEELVPGDIIRLTQGNRVPADAKIIYTNDLWIDEAVLTGESLPVQKSTQSSGEDVTLADQESMLFAGTLVTQGDCSAIICGIESATELGKIADFLASSENQKTPLQKAVIKFSIYSSIFLGILTILVFITGILKGYTIIDMFLTSVAIAVSAIPEGLPISMTIILAVGVERMAKRKGVIRKLVAAEALGSTTLILTDKTGTLTMAQMQLSKIIPFNKTEAELFQNALLNTDVHIENPEDDPNSWRMTGKIMEVALIKAAISKGIGFKEINNKAKIQDYLPFNSQHKYSVSLIKEGDSNRLILFGAADILINLSNLDQGRKHEILEEIDKLAYSGERVLGLATKDIENKADYNLTEHNNYTNLSFEGLITFRDPIRPNIKHIVATIHKAGIRTIIMTGDHKGTATSVAKALGMSVTEDSILDASELKILTKSELDHKLNHISVISRVTPFDKLEIVKLFQNKGEVVAMTGDGVNDAPSIKQANVGVAMGSGTEVAQSVADLVLLDDNFETIVAAIEEGRQILSNIKKVLVYLLSNVLDGLILIGGSLFTGLPLPLNALQILWVNFFADSFPAVAFAFEKEGDKFAHLKNPDNRNQLFDPLMRFLILVIGISSSLLLFALYYVLTVLGYEAEIVKTFIFGAFGTYTLLVAFSVRSLDKSILSYPLFSNKYLTFGIATGFCLMLAAIYIPLLQDIFGTVSLPIEWLAGVVLVGIVNIIMIEIAKKIHKAIN